MRNDLSSDALFSLFRESQALLEGHFQLSSGLHSGRYFQCALVLARPGFAERIGRALASLLEEKPDVVVSPAIGGLIIGHEVARALGVRAYFAERENGVMTLRRGFSLKPGEKVVVVEDVVTTGKSSREVVALVEAAGAKVAGTLAVVHRGSPDSDPGLKVESLARIPVEAFPPQDCPLCARKVPLVKPGSRPQPAC